MLWKNLLNDLQVTIKPTNGDHKQERLGNYYSKKAIFALLNESIVQHESSSQKQLKEAISNSILGATQHRK